MGITESERKYAAREIIIELKKQLKEKGEKDCEHFNERYSAYDWTSAAESLSDCIDFADGSDCLAGWGPADGVPD